MTSSLRPANSPAHSPARNFSLEVSAPFVLSPFPMTFFDLLGISILLTLMLKKKSTAAVGFCMVVSEPEGAQIYVDGKNSNVLTPGLVPLPLDHEMSLTLKKIGYDEIRAWIKSKHRLSFHYSKLVRTRLKLIDHLHEEI